MAERAAFPAPRARGAALQWAALLALALALACGRGGACARPSPPVAQGPAASQAGTVPEAPSSRPGGGAGAAGVSGGLPAAAARAGKVVRVLDGDSLVVLAGGRGLEVRLHGIDAPERGQAWGQRAKRRAGELAFGREVRLEPRGTDAYGRELAEAFLPDGRSLNRELVSEGLAWHYRRYSDDADLASREREARAARRGLWVDPAPVPPWEFREAARGGAPVR